MSSVFEQLMANHLASLSTESIEVEKVSGEGPKGADLVGAKITDLPKTKDNADEGNEEVHELVDAKITDLPKTANNADEGDDDVHDLVEAMMEEGKKMVEKQEEFEEGGRVHASLESLLIGTLDTYGNNGMNEQALALYSLSVESVLRAANLDLPVSAAVPSFEASDTQVAVAQKVETKGKGILKTIYDWIVRGLKFLGQALKKFVNLFKINKKKVADRATHMVALIESGKPAASATLAIGHDKGDEKKEEDAKEPAGVKSEIKINDNEAKILSRGGGVSGLDDAVKAVKSNYEATMRAWGVAFDPLINMPAAKGHVGEALKGINASLNGKVKGFKHDLNLNEVLVVKPGSDAEAPMIGAKVSIELMTDAKAANLTVPSKDVLVNLTKQIAKDLEEQGAAEKAMNSAAEHVEKRAAEYEKMSTDGDAGSVDVKKATSNLMSATSVFSNGIAQAGTSYVTSYNTLLNVIQRSIGHAA